MRPNGLERGWQAGDTCLGLPCDHQAYPAWLAWLDQHRLTPLAHRLLAGESLPADARQHLAAAYFAGVAAWAQRRHETLRLLELLSAPPAVPVVLLKGLALALYVYPEPALRPMYDLDVMAPEARLQEAAGRLRDHGYRSTLPELAHGFIEAHSHHINLASPGSEPPLHIELHGALPFLPLQRRAEVMAWFWDQCEPVALDRYQAFVFSPNAQLLHLAQHLIYQHGGAEATLIWLYDIDLLWRQRGASMDWRQIIAVARLAGWEAALHESLRLAVASFRTPLSPEARAWLDQPRQHLSGYQAVRRFTGEANSRSAGIVERMRYMPWRQRLRYAGRFVAPAPSYMQHRYPSLSRLFLPAAYVYRWLDIAGDVFRLVRQSLRG
jgi:hypothetical protein